MPINPAVIQKHVNVRQVHFTGHSNGELCFRDQSGNEAGEEIKVQEGQIIFVARLGNGYILVALHEDPENRDRTFELSGISSSELPQEILDAHLLQDLPEGLKGSDSNKLHVIVSTRSGIGLAQSFYDGVVEPLLAALGLTPRTRTDGPLSAAASESARDGPAAYDLIVTQSSQTVKDFAQDLWAQVIPDGPAGRQHTILLLSGDGGVVDLLNGSHKPPAPGLPHPTVAVVPLGTGNALFHSLHKPHYSSPTPTSHFALALHTLLRGAARPLPTFEAAFSPGARLITYSPPSDRTTANGGGAEETGLEEHAQVVDRLYGAIVASYGFHSQLIWESDTPEYRRHGDKRFAMVAGELLKEAHQYRAEVEVLSGGGARALLDGHGGLTTGKELPAGERRFTYVLAAMVSNLEKTFAISPASRPLDGRLRLVHFGGADGMQTMEIMKAAYQEGKHVGMTWSQGEDEGMQRAVGYDEVEEVKITVRESDARWRKVCVDGVIVEIPEGGWMSLSKVAQPSYRVLVA